MVHYACIEALQINPVIYDYFALNLGIKNDLAAITIGALWSDARSTEFWISDLEMQLRRRRRRSSRDLL